MVSSHVRAGLAAARPSPPFSPSPWSPSKKPPAPCCSHPLRSRRSPPRRRIHASHSSWWSCAPSCRGLRGPSWGPHVVLVAVGSERQESRETRPRTARENPSLIFHLPNESFANHFVSPKTKKLRSRSVVQSSSTTCACATLQLCHSQTMASRVSCCTPCGVSSAGASGRLARSVAYRQLPSPLPCGRRRSGLERKGVGGGSRPRRDDTVRRDAAEMMGVAVYADDLLEVRRNPANISTHTPHNIGAYILVQREPENDWRWLLILSSSSRQPISYVSVFHGLKGLGLGFQNFSTLNPFKSSGREPRTPTP